MTVQDAERIRTLNDDFRKKLTGGKAVMTLGVAALGPEVVQRVVQVLTCFDDFHHACDPYSEHDAGTFDLEGHTFFFEIDYYDKSLTAGSPNPADPDVTERVITLMLAEEY
jgi:hypothetical protein